MIVKGPILIPGIPDMSGDILDEETVRRAALIIARNGVLTDVQHTLRNVGKILGLYVLDTPMDWRGDMLPKGTVMGSIDVIDDDIQQGIREGKLNGFSILAAPTRTMEEMNRGIK
ncbi:XkdF-like putative serine protease domain-containing protein [uncultured Methanobrevibacter sp.]|uniref:XkdF-like putative serine protease domain-containing protein n=1 Tax=uncultured Methanobrevibacter sp. TaxID=253161 RepID=UPI0025D28AC7|nr:XkdF-like putative serine protease domain-containing protein [uncultured Methanobrevibacter sp.]